MRDDVRARPTLHLLAGLDDGWDNAYQRRHIQERRWKELHPLALLDHPALAKAVEQFGSDPAGDISKGTIACTGNLHLQKVRAGQWRAGVWADPATGVRWVVSAGLAKGGHKDADDFYERLKVLSKSTLETLLPTQEDYILLRRETVAAAMIEWRLDLQCLVSQMLTEAMAKGESMRENVPHPRVGEAMAKVCVTWSANHEPDYDCEDIVVEFFDVAQPNSSLTTVMLTQILTSIAPPSQDWDVVGGIYSALEEQGHAERQLAALRQASEDKLVLEPQRGQLAHYAHRRDITTNAINGDALRSLCGKFFVPMQDPSRFATCPECAEVRAQIG